MLMMSTLAARGPFSPWTISNSTTSPLLGAGGRPLRPQNDAQTDLNTSTAYVAIAVCMIERATLPMNCAISIRSSSLIKMRCEMSLRGHRVSFWCMLLVFFQLESVLRVAPMSTGHAQFPHRVKVMFCLLSDRRAYGNGRTYVHEMGQR